MDRQQIKHGYQVASELYDFINEDVLPGTAITPDYFWPAVADILQEFIPRNGQLLAMRESLQRQINSWHLDPANTPIATDKYRQFLLDIGYLLPEPDNFTISTSGVDAEIAEIAGPQLVVPLMNARFAINAANARWGSLYDALYGTDAIAFDADADADADATPNAGYDPKRGQQVIAFGRAFLDQTLPLATGSHSNAIRYHIEAQGLSVTLSTGEHVRLREPELFIGFNGSADKPNAILCRHHGLHIEIQLDEHHVIGKTDRASIKDIVLESAITTIQDCEDSIAAVDVSDKVLVYRNWLGLMNGTLSETLVKNGKTLTRTLNANRHYHTVDNQPVSLPGRSLQFIRNVGLLMTTDAMLTADDDEVPEGIVDAIVTSLIALHDLRALTGRNSATGSIYIVKPKMHGPDEVQFSCELFARVEQLLQLNANTIKMGIMDEERRTSVNLKACISAAKARVVFINTGFLDRTGDEIHTSMLAGAMVAKESMKNQRWIAAYEQQNVRIGLQAGFTGKAQIGKGMWATPDEMSAMLATKIAHPQAGATCAWVPSPTAATLHVLHYHQVNVANVQATMLSAYDETTQAKTELEDLLTMPLLTELSSLPTEVIQQELDNNVQGLLGYVVRWVNQGIGCSKVPDINNVARMEDRATLRISSQHIANWLHHGLLSAEQVMTTLRRMAVIVDRQNADDPNYRNMAPDFEQSHAFNAAVDLIFSAEIQPSGYTEPLLHQRRRQAKKSFNQ